ncbi:MAG: hypothetical protein U5L07_07905 [Desulfobacterales bacterium]|nr:hypothetical protein [Desulfobacterales bacterium]
MSEWTKKRARQGSRRRLDKIEKSFEELAYNWGDLDQYVIDKVDEIITAIDDLRGIMDESVKEGEYWELYEKDET